MSSPAWRARLAARWKQLREREFSVKTVQDMIDANARTLGDAADRNAARWPLRNGPYPDKVSFADDVAQMKSWIAARVLWLDDEIQRRSAQP
jgi:hypothetical protein